MTCNEVKSDSRNTWLGFVLYIIAGFVCGSWVVDYIDVYIGRDSSAKRLLVLVAAMLAVYAAMVVQAVIHEFGHMVFGLASGYRFGSFRIFSLMWIKEGDRLRVRRLKLAGTAGQCLMSPPDLKDGKIPVVLYNLGGVIMNLIAGAAFAGLSFLFPQAPALAVFLRFLAAAGALSAAVNGIPIRMGQVDNDGRNVLSMIMDPEAVRAFRLQLKITESLAGGARLRDLPDEWFAVPDDEALSNSIIAASGVFAANRLMDMNRFSEADGLIRHLLSVESGIIGLHRSMMTCDLIVTELLGMNRRSELDGLLTDGQKRFMKAMKRFPSVLRTEYALALLDDRDEEKARRIEEEFDRVAADYPYKGDIEGERELMSIVSGCAVSRRGEIK